MIKVDLYNENNKIVATLTLKSINGKIEFSGERAKAYETVFSEEKSLVYIDGKKTYLTLEEPLTFICYLYLAVKGVYLRASLPEFID